MPYQAHPVCVLCVYYVYACVLRSVKVQHVHSYSPGRTELHSNVKTNKLQPPRLLLLDGLSCEYASWSPFNARTKYKQSTTLDKTDLEL